MEQQSYLVPTRTSSLSLRDGRSLTWHEWGDPRDTPLLYITGAGMSGSLGFGTLALKELGLRMLSIDRPGLGASDPDHEKSFASWQQDVKELLLHLNVTRPRAVAFSQGAPFAYALASADLVSKLSVVSGQDDFAATEVFNMLPDAVRGFVHSVRTKNAKFLNDFAASVDAEGFMKIVLNMSSPKDLEIYGVDPFKSAYLRSLQEGFLSGPQGYVSDVVLALGDWPFAVSDISVPVQLWYGELDANPTHSPDLGEKMAKKLPIGARYRIADEGGSLLWTKSKEILATLFKK